MIIRQYHIKCAGRALKKMIIFKRIKQTLSIRKKPYRHIRGSIALKIIRVQIKRWLNAL